MARRSLDKGPLAGIAEVHRRVVFKTHAIPLLVRHPIIEQQINAGRSQFHGSFGLAEGCQRVERVESLSQIVLLQFNGIALAIDVLAYALQGQRCPAVGEKSRASVLVDHLLVQVQTHGVFSRQHTVQQAARHVAFHAAAQKGFRPHLRSAIWYIGVIGVERPAHSLAAQANGAADISGIYVAQLYHGFPQTPATKRTASTVRSPMTNGSPGPLSTKPNSFSQAPFSSSSTQSRTQQRPSAQSIAARIKLAQASP